MNTGDSVCKHERSTATTSDAADGVGQRPSLATPGRELD